MEAGEPGGDLVERVVPGQRLGRGRRAVLRRRPVLERPLGGLILGIDREYVEIDALRCSGFVEQAVTIRLFKCRRDRFAIEWFELEHIRDCRKPRSFRYATSL